jgi:hypothetical protein
MWDPGNAAYTLVARVRAREEVQTVEGGRCQAWRIEVEESEGPAVYWVESGSRTLMRYRAGTLEILRFRHPACPAQQAVQTAMN